MLGNAKELKRNNRECKGILIGPSMAPRFLPRYRDSVAVFCPFARKSPSASGQISRRGWQADDQLSKNRTALVKEFARSAERTLASSTGSAGFDTREYVRARVGAPALRYCGMLMNTREDNGR